MTDAKTTIYAVVRLSVEAVIHEAIEGPYTAPTEAEAFRRLKYLILRLVGPDEHPNKIGVIATGDKVEYIGKPLGALKLFPGTIGCLAGMTPKEEPFIYQLGSVEWKGCAIQESLKNDFEKRYKWNLKSLWALLKEHKVTKVTVGYDGGGDSGDIHQPSFEYSDPIAAGLAKSVAHIPIAILREPHKYWHTTPNKDETNKVGVEVQTVAEAFRYLAELYPENYGIDWYNNDGGGGSLILDVTNKTWSATTYVYETVSHDALSEGGSL